METKMNKIKEFDTVQTFRKIKEDISNDIWGLSYEQLMDYFQKSKKNKCVSEKKKLAYA